MPIDDNVFIAGSKGETCIVCERDIPQEEACIKFRFNVFVIIKMVERVEAMHYDCAGGMHYLLGQRIMELQKLVGKRR